MFVLVGGVGGRSGAFNNPGGKKERAKVAFTLVWLCRTGKTKRQGKETTEDTGIEEHIKMMYCKVCSGKGRK